MSSCPEDCPTSSVNEEDLKPDKGKEQEASPPLVFPRYTCTDPTECCNIGKQLEDTIQTEAPTTGHNETLEIKESQEQVKVDIVLDLAEEKKEKTNFGATKKYDTDDIKLRSNFKSDLEQGTPNLQVLTQSAKSLSKPSCKSLRVRPPRSPAKSPAKSPRDSMTMSPTKSPRGLPRTPRASLSGSASPKLSPNSRGNKHQSSMAKEGKKKSLLPQGDNLKAVLFDVDGTIADSDPLHFQAFQETLAEAGFNSGMPINQEFFISQMSGKLNTVVAQELLPEVDEALRQVFLEKKEARFRSLATTELKSISGFHRFVKWVKQRGLKRAAVTNAPRENAEQILNALGVTDFFDILVVGSECENPKPFPDPYLQTIKHLGIEPSKTIVLEDSPSGVKASVAAGLATVGLLTGHPGPVLKSNGAALLIKDYNDADLWTSLGYPAGNRSTSVSPTPPETSPILENITSYALKVVA